MKAEEVLKEIEECVEETQRLVVGHGTDNCIARSFAETLKKLTQLKELVCHD